MHANKTRACKKTKRGHTSKQGGSMHANKKVACTKKEKGSHMNASCMQTRRGPASCTGEKQEVHATSDRPAACDRRRATGGQRHASRQKTPRGETQQTQHAGHSYTHRKHIGGTQQTNTKHTTNTSQSDQITTIQEAVGNQENPHQTSNSPMTGLSTMV